MKPGSLAYKCRRCGAIFHPVHTPDGRRSLDRALFGTPLPSGWFGTPPSVTEIHYCSEDALGVADLIGADFD